MMTETTVSIRSAQRLRLGLVAIALAAGCSQQLMPTPNIYLRSTKDCFDDVPEHFRNNKVEVLYVTDRARTGEKHDRCAYGADRSDSLAYGLCTVAIGRNVSWPDLVRESRSKTRWTNLALSCEAIRELGRLPDTPVPVVRVDGALRDDPAAIAEAEAAREAFAGLVAERVARSPERKHAYVFIHGFNNSFEDAAFIAAELWHFLGRRGVPMIYTWPAGRSYAYDRESGEFTVFHLKQFLRGLASCPSIEKVHILAHSRGTDVLLTALRELHIAYKAAGQSGGSDLKLGNVVLAAADLDLQVVRQRIVAERLPLLPERLTVYASPTDRAIEAAEWLFKSGRRVGELRPDDMTPKMRQNLGHLTNMSIIQARVGGSFIGHDYFHSSPAVSSDLILMLRDDRGPGAEHGRPLTKHFDNFWEIGDEYPGPAKGKSPAAARR